VIFIESKLKGVLIVKPELLEDERGFFARTWCRNEFNKHGLNRKLAQCSISFNKKRGTLRGLHYQAPSHEEAKLVRCTAGAIYDVIIDLRPGSDTFKQWIAVELTAENRQMLYVPEGCAHGFQTLMDDTEVFYQMSRFFNDKSARGVRWNDRALAIAWPIDNPIICERDRTFPDFQGDES
jgi:dTDP-4-dehydrorhamnose 3,5-epimerase